VPEAKPILAAPDPGTIAAQAGVARGDTVRAINDEPVAGWQDVRWRLLQLALEREEARLGVIDARGEPRSRTLDLARVTAAELEGDLLARLGLKLEPPRAVIGEVLPGGAAARAGLAPGDRVAAIGGEPIETWAEFVTRVRASPGRPLLLEIQRGAERRRLEVTPEAVTEGDKTIGWIGAGSGAFHKVSYAPLDAATKALARTWEMSVFSLRMLGKMIVGEVSWRNLSGPVTIADYAGQSASLGLAPYLTFLALISISLGVLNLLPIPLLDGGHLMYYAIELLKGSPVSERVMELGQRAGLAVLLFLMAFALYNDMHRLFSG
jgi:regulator of sigma E protease